MSQTYLVEKNLLPVLNFLFQNKLVKLLGTMFIVYYP